MQITFNEISNTKYMQIYLTKEELEQQKTKEIIQKYKEQKYKIGLFVTGKEYYPEVLKKIVAKQVELSDMDNMIQKPVIAITSTKSPLKNV